MSDSIRDKTNLEVAREQVTEASHYAANHRDTALMYSLAAVIRHLEEATRETPATEPAWPDSSSNTTGRSLKPSESSPASRGLMNELSALMGRIWAWHRSTGFTERELQEIQASYWTLKSIYESPMPSGATKDGALGRVSPEPAGIEAARRFGAADA